MPTGREVQWNATTKSYHFPKENTVNYSLLLYTVWPEYAAWFALLYLRLQLLGTKHMNIISNRNERGFTVFHSHTFMSAVFLM